MALATTERRRRSAATAAAAAAADAVMGANSSVAVRVVAKRGGGREDGVMRDDPRGRVIVMVSRVREGRVVAPRRRKNSRRAGATETMRVVRRARDARREVPRRRETRRRRRIVRPGRVKRRDPRGLAGADDPPAVATCCRRRGYQAGGVRAAAPSVLSNATVPRASGRRRPRAPHSARVFCCLGAGISRPAPRDAESARFSSLLFPPDETTRVCY